MSLPERYGKRVRQALGAIAVWQPGDPVPLGAIMKKEGGRFNEIDQLSRFTGIATTAVHQDKSLDLVSKGTKQRIFQAGVELPSTAALDLTAEASVKYEFSRAFEYVLKTPTLKGQHITNVNQIAQAVRSHPEWRHKEFFLVHEVYDAEQFSFVGSETRKGSLTLSGKGAGILGFLTAGASADLSSSGDVQLKLIGAGGTLAMGLVRIKKDGSTDFLP
jgi:hypothetical protein